jgi:hypothetical protein
MLYKTRLTNNAPTEADIYRHNSADKMDASIASVRKVIDGFYASGSQSVPSNEGEIHSTDENGRAVCASIYSGFVSIADAETFIRSVMYASDPTKAVETDAWNIAHDCRSKAEILDAADDSVVTLLHDNIQLTSRTQPIDLAETPDPFIVPAE